MSYDYKATSDLLRFISRYREITLWTDSDGNEAIVYECRKCFALVQDTASHTSVVHSESIQPGEESGGSA